MNVIVWNCERALNSTRLAIRYKRKNVRRRELFSATRRFMNDLGKNIFSCRVLHRKFTLHQQLFHIRVRFLTELDRPITLKPFMHSRVKLVLVTLTLTVFATPAQAETVTLFRVFLNDGTAVVSYGEYARVGDRVIFSMPIGVVAENTAAKPNLHVVNIPAAAVDWAATVKFTDGARYAQYLATNADSDYAELTGAVASVLNAIVINKDPKARLQMAVDARRRLASWPREHYGYRSGDVSEILGLLDEAISSMRAAAGETSFAIDLIADTAAASPPAPSHEILPNPTASESLAQAMAVAQVTDIAADRVALLKSIVAAIDAADYTLPGQWAVRARKSAIRTLKEEGQIDKRYSSMTASLLKRAGAAAARADVRTVEGAIVTVLRRDARLGKKRPDEVNALLVQMQIQLDSARHLRLVRDGWKERVGSYRAYLKTIVPVIDTLTRAQHDLDNIKRLAGSEAVDLVALIAGIGTSAKLLNTVGVPDELKAAHALLVSALNLADSAVRTRRSAVMSGELRSAWDASSAAAGSITLFARAQEDMEAIIKLPQIR